MAAYQMLVRGLDGRTACLQFSSHSIPGRLLHDYISGIFAIPADFLRIVTGTREITPQLCLHADADGLFPSCNLILRLPGGKGGFGSLLRGAGTKAGQKKTSNFDACRDMSGRRLRHVNAEKKLKEWNAEAKERELEKAANAFLKKQMKRKEKDSGSSKEIEKYREETSRAMEEVELAVARGLAEAKKLGKRKQVEDRPTTSKRSCIWVTDADVRNEDGISEEEFEEESIEEGSQVKECLGDGLANSAHTCEEESIEEGSQGKECSGDGFANSAQTCEGRNKAKEDGFSVPNCDTAEDGLLVPNSSTKKLTDGDCAGGSNEVQSGSKVIVAFSNGNNGADSADCQTGRTAIFVTAEKLAPQQLNFDEFQNAAELEVLGLERLKCELQARGLKCGGSVAERAARLFLLKCMPLDKLDQKHFAKAK